jgi:hypothetical protein
MLNLEQVGEILSMVIDARYSRPNVREVAMELGEEYWRMVRDGVIRATSEEVIREGFSEYLSVNMR